MSQFNEHLLNREYQRRQERKAQQGRIVRTAIEARRSQTQNNGLKSSNIISLTTIVVSMLLLGIFFFSGGYTHAQDSPSFSSESVRSSGGIEWLLLAVGLDALQAGDFPSAERSFADCLEANPQFAAAYAALSLTYWIQGDELGALEQAQIGLEANADSAEIHFVLGMFYAARGTLEDSRSHYETYLALVDERGTEPAMMTRLLGAGMSITLAEAQLESSFIVVVERRLVEYALV